jgi:hypothetical protein
MKMKKLILLVLLVMALGLLPVAGQATVYTFTNEAAFKAALTTFYTADYTPLAIGDTGVTSLPFSGSDFSYTLSIPDNGSDTLWGFPGNTPPALSVSTSDVPITGSLFASTGQPLVAIGGLFYLTDFAGTPVDGTINATINGVTSAAIDSVATGALHFFGVIDTAGISSLLIDTGGASGSFATISDLTVGASAVPLPPSVLLLGSGLLGLIGFRRKFVK